jgi:hypothetical protein
MSVMHGRGKRNADKKMHDGLMIFDRERLREKIS